MMEIRRSEERGVAEHGWLSSRHSFSFAHYYDLEHMGFGPLRVINEDRVLPGRGFGMHGHSDMEIISYVLEGSLEHKDSMGNGSVLRYGDVQRMSAGTGVMHSEFNPSRTEPVHFLQIWILPNKRNLAPSYEERHFDAAIKQGVWRLVASPDGSDGSVQINQDARIYAALLSDEDVLDYAFPAGRRGYLHVARGSIKANSNTLHAGDALKLEDEPVLQVAGTGDAEVLLFDLP